jgi:MFS family permease
MEKYLRSIAALPLAVKWFLATEMIFGLSIGIWNINLNFHLKSCGFADLNIGSVLAFGSIATAVFSFFVGGLCDRIGFHPAMFFGCLIKGVGMSLIALFQYPLATYAGFAIMSLGDSLVLSSEFPFILSLVEEQLRDMVYNLLICAYLFAFFFGNMAGGYLPGLFSEMKDIYFIPVLISGILFLMLGAARSFLPKKKVDYESKKISFEIFKDSKILMFLLYGMLMSLAFNILGAMLNIIYRDSFHLEDNKIGLAFSAATGVMFLSSFLVPLIMKRWRSKNISVFSMLVNIPLLLIMSVAGLKLFFPVWLLYSFLRLTLPGTVDNRMLQVIPKDKQGSYSGMRIFSNSIGMGIGSSLAGILLEYSNYTFVILCCAGFTLLQLLTYYFGCRKHLEA